MAVKRLSNFRIQYDDGNGALASGYRLFFYAAGSTTKQNTYNSSTGLSANSNPLTLNALGEPSTEIWLTAGLSYKMVLAPAGSDDPPNAPTWTEDVITGVNDATVSASEWVAGPTPTYVSGTQFTLAGDQTSIFTVNRRIQATVTAGTVYGYISVSAYAALTTITVVLDSGALDSGLSAVNYALLNSTNPSVPAQFPKNGGPANFTTLSNTGNITTSAGQITAGVAGVSGVQITNSGIVGTIDAQDLVLRRATTEFARGTATGMTVTGLTNSTTGFQFNGAALPNQTKSSIADQAITSAAALTLAHGLSALPQRIDAFLVCQTGEAGYTAGQITPTPIGALVTTGTGLSVIPDATNLVVRFGSPASAFIAAHATTGVPTSLTNGNWKLRLIAYA